MNIQVRTAASVAARACLGLALCTLMVGLAPADVLGQTPATSPASQPAPQYHGQKVLALFHAYPIGKFKEDNREALAAAAKTVEEALDKAKVKVVHVVRTSRDFLDQDTSVHFDQMMLLDCQGKDPAEALKDVPYRQAAIVFEDGNFRASLPSPQDKKARVPAPCAFKSWGSGEVAKRDAELRAFGLIKGLRVEYTPPLAGGAGAGGSAGFARFFPEKGMTLLEVFALTKAGFELQAATTSASSPAASTEPARFDRKKGGIFQSGKWEYRYTVGKGPAALGGGEAASGTLFFDGKAIPAANQNDYILTPWGRMYWNIPQKEGPWSSGWLTWTDDARAGHKIDPPTGD